MLAFLALSCPLAVHVSLQDPSGAARIDPQPILAGPGYDGPVAVRELDGSSAPLEIRRFEKGGIRDLEAADPRLLGDPYFLGFAGGVHRPPRGERIDPRLVTRLVEGPAPSEDPDWVHAYLLFEGAQDEAKREKLRSVGVRLLRYHPNNAMSARLPRSRALEIAYLPELRWVGLAPASLKLHPALLHGLESGEALLATGPHAGKVQVHVACFESELGPFSERVLAAPAFENDPQLGSRPGSPEAAGYRWIARGPVQRVIEGLGGEVLDYLDPVDVYHAVLPPEQVLRLLDHDRVAGLEWAATTKAHHEYVVPQVAHDYSRYANPVTTQTVGVLDTGFAILNAMGAGTGHVDLEKFAVGWDYWNGGCGSAFCDEAASSFHGSHVLGTIAGSGFARADRAGMSPMIGAQPNQRLFLVKYLHSLGFAHMRQAYTDPQGRISPRPWAINNSWGVDGCSRSGQALNFIGSEAHARATDDEVFQRHQLYVFSAGNDGRCGMNQDVARTIGDPGVAKNALTIGSVDSVCIYPLRVGGVSGFSSRGPCGDGRWKPNLVAPGCLTNSVHGGSLSGYQALWGTSMAAPVVVGALSSVAETRVEFRENSALARAWAMATAMTWSDATSTTPGGWLPDSHLNRYGLGRVSSLKAHVGGGVYPWRRNWAWDDVQAETDAFDIAVDPGTTRLVVVMTYDDPAAAPLANPALVEDIDLIVDREPFDPNGFLGDYRSRSTIQSVEHVIVEAPAPGNYRIKINPVNLSRRIAWGCMAVQIQGDTTPQITLSTNADRRWIRPGGRVGVFVDVRASSTIASNILVENLNNGGFALTRVVGQLQDGTALINHQAAFRDVLIGDVSSVGPPRVLDYQFDDQSMRDRIDTLDFRAAGDNAGPVIASVTIGVDGTPPPTPTLHEASTHVTGVWSNSRLFRFDYDQAPDNLAGVTHVALASAETPNIAIPVGNRTPHTGSITTSVAQDSSSLYFAMLSEDFAGNTSANSNVVGPYLVDTVPPGEASGLSSSTHPVGIWSSDLNLHVDWIDAVDDRSGIAGYSITLSQGVPVQPDATIELSGVTSHTIALPGSGRYYFGLRAIDLAGNPSASFATYGPILVDLDPPQNVGIQIDGTSGHIGRSLDVTLTISGSDLVSGIAAMRFQNASELLGSGTWSPWEGFAHVKRWNLASNGGSALGGGHSVIVEVRDVAGNVASAFATMYYVYEPELFGQACPGLLGLPSMDWGGAPMIGGTLIVDVSNTAASLAGLYFGFSDTSWNGIPLPLDLGFLGGPGCLALAAWDIQLYTGVPGAPAVFLPIPPDPLIGEAQFYLQWVLLGDPVSPVVTTEGLRVRISGI